MASSTPDIVSRDVASAPLQSGDVLATADAATVEVVDYRPSLSQAIRDAWHSRHLLWQLASTALSAYLTKYRLGPFWLIFQTFMAVAGYSLIFGGAVFSVRTPNHIPYFLFMMVGMMGWQLFQTTLHVSALSFMRLKTVIRDLHVPLILVPIAGSAQALLRFALYFVGYAIAVVYFWIARGHFYVQLEPKYLLMSIAGLGLSVALAWGISLWTAPLTAHTRDVRMVLRFVIPFWMFVTPVLYPIDQLHGKTRFIAELNPLSSPVEMAKVGLLGAGSVRLYAAIWSVGAITLVFASGIWFMSRFASRVVMSKQGVDDEDDEDMLL